MGKDLGGHHFPNPMFFRSRHNQVQVKAIPHERLGGFGQCGELDRVRDRSDLSIPTSVSKSLVSGKCAIRWDEVYNTGL